MIDYFSFRIFLACLIACATMVLGAIWFGDKIAAPVYFRTTATLFVVGLGSFLIWFSMTLRNIHQKMPRS